MIKLSRRSLGLLATGVAIAAPISSHASAGPASAHVAIGRAPAAIESGLPGTDPGSPNFRWYLQNPRPCVRDTVVLVVAGFDSTPCVSFVEAFARDSAHVVYHTQVRDSMG